MIRINIFENIVSKICHKKSAQSEEIGKKSHNVNFFCENPNPAQSVKRTKGNCTKLLFYFTRSMHTHRSHLKSEM